MSIQAKTGLRMDVADKLMKTSILGGPSQTGRTPLLRYQKRQWDILARFPIQTFKLSTIVEC
jgi:hypothetical protein